MIKPTLRLLLSILLVLPGINLMAQMVPPDLAAGLQPYQAYQGGNIDQINLSNGNLHVRIPLMSYAQRGGKLKLSYALIFDGKPYNNENMCGPPDPGTGEKECNLLWMHSFTGGWRIVDEQAVGETFYEVSYPVDYGSWEWFFRQWITSDGAMHVGSPVTSVNGQTGQASVDGSGYYDGYNYGSYGQFPSCVSHCYPTDADGISYGPSTNIAREDANGNYIAAAGDSYPAGTILDTMGRYIPPPPGGLDTTLLQSPQPSSPVHCPALPNFYQESTWQPPGRDGIPLTFTFCTVEVPINIPAWGGGESGLTVTAVRLAMVILPNGLSWSFQYNSQNPGDPAPPNGQTWNYGDLSEMTFPTGGTINYSYSLFWRAVPAAVGMYTASRTVHASSSDTSQPFKYTYTSLTTKVTDPYGSDSVHTFQDFNGTSGDYFETNLVVYKGSSSGPAWKTVVRNYSSASVEKGKKSVVFPTSVVTTLDNGKISETDTQYCCSFTAFGTTSNMTYGRPSDVKVYDYGASPHGSLLQEKETTYEFQTNTNYLLANLINAVATLDVYDGVAIHDASTEYIYDEPSYLTTSGLGSTQQLATTPLSSVRGNITSTVHGLIGGTPPVTHTNWYDSGEPYKSIDALANTAATYTYSPSIYWSGLPTSTSNAKGQTTQYFYDSAGLGLKIKTIDPNNQATSYGYDTLGRLTSVTTPDTCTSGQHGETSYAYSDTIPASYTATLLTCSGTDNVKVDIDGLGRETREEELSAPTPPGVIYVDTTYDPMGRQYQVSNPYHSTSEQTYGVTTYLYDSLSRPTTVTYPDVSAVSYTYTGAAVKVTDGGNGSRPISTISQEDALGRNTSVCEVWPSPAVQALAGATADQTPVSCATDITGLNGFITGYGYDGVGNLKSVTQGSLPNRAFTYDSLSRLLTAYNPESGTTSYTYDANSNVHTRVRPSPNQLSNGTVLATTTYAYDVLNRPTDIVYTDTFNASTPTQPVHYDYDTASTFTIGGTQNAIGRMVDSYVKEPSGIYDAARAFSYDPVGRELYLAECTIDDCQSTPPQPWWYEMNYTFDTDGNPLNMKLLTAAGDTSGFTLGYTYNAIGQLSTMTSSWVDAYHPGTLISGTTYGPLGGLVSSTLGNGAIESFAYDQMNRLGCETVMKGATTLYSVALSSANTQCTGFSASGYSGDGNVVKSQDSVNGNWTYTYDDMNRLVTATASSGPWSGKTAAWTYDRFGNRWTQTLTGQTPQSFTFNQGNNRTDQSATNYDPAGNLKVDPQTSTTYTYDDENRVIKGVLSGAAIAQYWYDAEGQRIRKISTAGTEEYVYDSQGHQIGEMQSNGSLNRVELYAGNRHLATYDNVPNQTIFVHNDWQGTERARSTLSGSSYETCVNLPFGDTVPFTAAQACAVTGAAPDPSPLHYTGKMRDAETTLDYFGARYYSNGMGHWMSPDWAANPTSVPYANFGDPQSLNLYAFVSGSPVSHDDSDGHLITLQQLNSYGGDGAVVGDQTSGLNGTPDGLGYDLQNAHSSLDSIASDAEDRYVSITQDDFDPEGVAHDTTEYQFSGGSGTIAEKQLETLAIEIGKEALAKSASSLSAIDLIQKIYSQLAQGGLSSAPGKPLVGGNYNFDYSKVTVINIADVFSLKGDSNRRGFIPSPHFHQGPDPKHDLHYVHLDSGNGHGVGFIPHAIIDLLLGNTFLLNGIPRCGCGSE